MQFILRKSSLILLLILTTSVQVFSQITEIESEEKDHESADFANWTDRIVVGGNVGAGFGNFTYVDVSPLAGYRFTKSLTAGIGFTYQYYKVNYNDPFFTADYKGNVIGGRIFTEYDIFYGLFAHVEYEQLWYNFTFEDASLGEYKGVVPALYLGGGYNFMIGENSKFQIMVLYDVLYTNESLNLNPWVIRMGFSIGL